MKDQLNLCCATWVQPVPTFVLEIQPSGKVLGTMPEITELQGGGTKVSAVTCGSDRHSKEVQLLSFDGQKLLEPCCRINSSCTVKCHSRCARLRRLDQRGHPT